MNALVDIRGLGIGAADHAVAPVVDAIDPARFLVCAARRR